jgi:hypothetical protein
MYMSQSPCGDASIFHDEEDVILGCSTLDGSGGADGVGDGGGGGGGGAGSGGLGGGQGLTLAHLSSSTHALLAGQGVFLGCLEGMYGGGPGGV